MKLDQVIAHRNKKTIYRDGARCIKVFDAECSKADVLNEALNLARKYLHLFCRKSDTAMQYVQKWMPIVAASQSVKGNADERYQQVKALLELMCPVHEEPNLLGARWSKLLINATFSGLGTVVGGTFGDVSENKDAQKVAIRCMKECIDVGHAAGVTFAPVQGKDITKLFYYKGAVKRAIGILLLPIAMKKHRGIVPSMLQDLRAGKPCEVDAINGVVCDYGRRLGVPTPINDRIAQIIRDAQAGKLQPCPENIRRFDDLL